MSQNLDHLTSDLKIMIPNGIPIAKLRIMTDIASDIDLHTISRVFNLINHNQELVSALSDRSIRYISGRVADSAIAKHIDSKSLGRGILCTWLFKVNICLRSDIA